MNGVSVELTPFQKMMENSLNTNLSHELHYKMVIFAGPENKIVLYRDPKVQYEFYIRHRQNFVDTEDYITSYIRNIDEKEVIFVQESDLILKTYWIDPKEGMKSLAEYLVNSFHMETIDTVMVDAAFMKKSFVDWVNNEFDGEIKHMLVNIQFGCALHREYLLKTCRKAKFLGFFCNHILEFEHIPNFDTDDVFFYKTSPFEMKILIALSQQATSVTLFDCSAATIVGELNSFVKYWLESFTTMKMKYLYAVAENLQNEFLSGVDYENVDPETRRSFQIHDECPAVIFAGGMTIRREDGAVLSICITPLLRAPKLAIEFYFWPDYNGRMEL